MTFYTPNIPSDMNPYSVEAINYLARIFSDCYQKCRDEVNWKKKEELKIGLRLISDRIILLCLEPLEPSSGSNESSKQDSDDAFLYDEYKNGIEIGMDGGNDPESSDHENKASEARVTDKDRFSGAKVKVRFKDFDCIFPGIIGGVYISDLYTDLLLEMLGYQSEDCDNPKGTIYNHKENPNFVAQFKYLLKLRRNNYILSKYDLLKNMGIVKTLPKNSDYYDGKAPKYRRVSKQEMDSVRVIRLDAPYGDKENEKNDYYSKVSVDDNGNVSILDESLGNDSYGFRNPEEIIIERENKSVLEAEFARMMNELRKIFEFRDETSKNKKIHIYHSAYTYDTIRITEGEKRKNDEGKPVFNPYGEYTAFCIERDLLIRPTMRDELIVYLKGGTPDEYRTMESVIKKDLLLTDRAQNRIDMNKRGEMIFNHLAECGIEVGKSTVARILKNDYDEFKQVVMSKSGYDKNGKNKFA